MQAQWALYVRPSSEIANFGQWTSFFLLQLAVVPLYGSGSLQENAYGYKVSSQMLAILFESTY